MHRLIVDSGSYHNHWIVVPFLVPKPQPIYPAPIHPLLLAGKKAGLNVAHIRHKVNTFHLLFSSSHVPESDGISLMKNT